MKRYEWFNNLTDKRNSPEEQAKGMVRARSEETGEDVLDVYEKMYTHNLDWLNDEYVPKNK